MPDAAAATDRKLTKKEKKALAFRASKGKGKATKDAAPSFEDEVAAIDAIGADDDAADQEDERTKSKANKKRKRDDADGAPPAAGAAAGTSEGTGEGEEQPQKKKKRQRGKTQAQRDREARLAAQGGGGDGEAGGASAGEGAFRKLLFVGNLPFKVTVDEIKKHFESCGEVPTVRLLTPKANSSSFSSGDKPPASKGCAFLEFTTTTGLQTALRLHQSSLSGRKINVELTAGGGGNSESRKAKIEAQRKKLNEEREKAAKNKRVKEGESENGDKTGRWKLAAEKLAATGEGGAEAAGEGDGEGEPPRKKKNVRDRRLKNGVVSAVAAPKTGDNAAEKRRLEAKALKASSGANAIKLASGWGNKATGA
ncbi:hypothetical protein JCM10908_000966 [Rhodotorula pacifica]|uniref:RNA-binding protein n=1 Tax=Rhodotorula pacifica TaxID=1495444 RepID=UPI00317E97A7